MLRKGDTLPASEPFTGCLKLRDCSIIVVTVDRHAVHIARRNSRQPDQIKSTVGILPGYPRRSMVYSGIATPLSMYGAGRLSAGLSIRVNRSNMAGNYLNRSGNAGTLKGYGSIQTTVIPCVVQHSQYGLLH